VKSPSPELLGKVLTIKLLANCVGSQVGLNTWATEVCVLMAVTMLLAGTELEFTVTMQPLLWFPPMELDANKA
jgi:hypothetical protein